jgi:hypothetical protein
MSGCITTEILPPLLRSRGRRILKDKYYQNCENDSEMREQNNNRTKWLHLRLKPEEFSHLQKNFSKTTCRKISDYARQILLNKPVTSTYRNQSLDDFMAEMIKLRNELNSLGNNFNQAVKKLHTLQQIAEFKNWLMTYEKEKNMVIEKVDEIKNGINKIADKWLQ